MKDSRRGRRPARAKSRAGDDRDRRHATGAARWLKNPLGLKPISGAGRAVRRGGRDPSSNALARMHHVGAPGSSKSSIEGDESVRHRCIGGKQPSRSRAVPGPRPLIARSTEWRRNGRQEQENRNTPPPVRRPSPPAGASRRDPDRRTVLGADSHAAMGSRTGVVSPNERRVGSAR